MVFGLANGVHYTDKNPSDHSSMIFLKIEFLIPSRRSVQEVTPGGCYRAMRLVLIVFAFFLYSDPTRLNLSNGNSSACEPQTCGLYTFDADRDSIWN